MSLADVSHGPDWVIWIVFAIFVALAITFLTGHGSGLIAGYNTASEKEKAKYDEKKLCRTFGVGMAVIAVTILVTALLEDQLPMEVLSDANIIRCNQTSNLIFVIRVNQPNIRLGFIINHRTKLNLNAFIDIFP